MKGRLARHCQMCWGPAWGLGGENSQHMVFLGLLPGSLCSAKHVLFIINLSTQILSGPFFCFTFYSIALAITRWTIYFLGYFVFVPFVNNLIYCLCPLPEWKLHEAWVFYFLLCVSSALKTAHIGGLKNIWLSDWKPGPSPAKRRPVFSTHTHRYTKTHIPTPFIRLRLNQL